MKAVMNILGVLLLTLNVAWATNNGQQRLHSGKDSVLATTSLVALSENVEVLSYEGKNLQCRIIEHRNQVVAVHYATVSEGLVKIKILNEDTQQVVHIDRVRKRKMAVKKYDLSKLPEGKYMVEVAYGGEVATKFIQIQ